MEVNKASKEILVVLLCCTVPDIRRSQNEKFSITVTFSFVCGKYYLIMD